MYPYMLPHKQALVDYAQARHIQIEGYACSSPLVRESEMGAFTPPRSSFPSRSQLNHIVTLAMFCLLQVDLSILC